jgi:Cys-tRNA(Pro) deacylase
VSSRAPEGLTSGPTNSDPPASERLRRFLLVERVSGELVRPGSPTPTVALAAAALGVAESAIVKSIVLQHRKDASRVCVAIVPGHARVSASRVAEALGEAQLRLARPAVALTATGFAVGGIPPVGHRRRLPVVVDHSVMAESEVFGGGGDEDHMLRITPAEIVRLTRAVVAPIVDSSRVAP